jgi:Flp pilus assembly protein CpaB
MSRKRGGLAFLFLGMIVAAGVAWMVFNQAQKAAQTARLETVEVLVAAQDIPERAIVAAPHLAVKRVLPSSLPPNALVRPDQAVGKMTTDPIFAGEFVLPGKLVGPDSGRPAIAYTVPKGKVVITVPASDILTTGAIQPGDIVDLLVTISPPEKEGRDQTTPRPNGQPEKNAPAPTPTPAARSEVEVGTTQTTMQNLKVLGIGSVAPQTTGESKDAKSQPQSGGGRNALAGSIITFAVDHQDALVLKSLKDSERVKMELVLRAAGDEQVAKTDAITLNTIVDRYSFRAVPTPRPAGG